jgi:hypothetical protein
MIVTAKAGVKVPTEFKPNEYITDADKVEVENSAYYLRRISDGDLIELTEKQAKAALKNTAE